MLQVLKDVALQPGGTYYKEHPNATKRDISYSDLSDGVRGFYFSANWVRTFSYVYFSFVAATKAYIQNDVIETSQTKKNDAST